VSELISNGLVIMNPVAMIRYAGRSGAGGAR
jgi:hypothetical protein